MQFSGPGIVSSIFSSIFEVPFPPYTILNGIALNLNCWYKTWQLFDIELLLFQAMISEQEQREEVMMLSSPMPCEETTMVGAALGEEMIPPPRTDTTIGEEMVPPPTSDPFHEEVVLEDTASHGALHSKAKEPSDTSSSSDCVYTPVTLTESVIKMHNKMQVSNLS